MKIIKRVGNWAVTNFGIAHLGQPEYEIEKETFYNTNWIGHIADKRWANLKDFKKVFDLALEYHSKRRAA